MYVMYGKKWYSPSNVCAICDIKLLQLVGCHLSNTYKLTGIPGHIVTTVSFSKVVPTPNLLKMQQRQDDNQEH